MIASESLVEISTALRAAQNAIPPIVKTKTARVQMKQGGTYSYNYADLSDIIDILRPVLMEYGLCFVQDALEAQGGVRVSTRILHTSGEWIEFGPLFLPGGETPQAYGSAITYARRYALTTAFGIAAEEDDDGQAGKPARQRASGASSSASASLPVSSAGSAPEPTSVGGATQAPETAPSPEVPGGTSAPADSTSGTGAGEAGTAPEEYGEGSDGAVPATNDLATEEDWQTAAENGLTTTKAKAIAKGLGITVTSAVDLTRADFSRVINKYLEMQAAKK